MSKGSIKNVALHPSGYYIAVSFSDKLRLFHIMHKELRFHKEIEHKGKLCNLVNKMTFSNGGQYLAVCLTTDDILILNAYSL